MYREQWVCDQLKNRSVLQVALDIHMAVCGSGEWYIDIEKDVEALNNILVNWKVGQERYAEFDKSVYIVLDNAVKEYERWKRERKENFNVSFNKEHLEQHRYNIIGKVIEIALNRATDKNYSTTLVNDTNGITFNIQEIK